MRKILLGAVSAVLLAGCSTTSPDVRQAENRASCDGYGFREGSNEFAQCMMLLDQQQQAEATRQRQAVGAAFGSMGQSMQNQSVACNTTYTSSGIVGRPAVGSVTTCQ